MLGGASGALALAVGEALVGGARGGGALPAAAGAAVGLLLPAGVLGGGMAALAVALLPPEQRPLARLRAVGGPADPQIAGRLIAGGLGALLGLGAAYALIHHFLSAYHHQGLAALALCAALTVLVVGVVLVSQRGATGLAVLLGRLPERLRARVARPATALLFVLGAWTAALVPPLVRGPGAYREGPFGFVGLVRTEALAAGPLVAAAALVASTALFGGWLARRPRRWLGRLALIVGLLALLGPVWTAALVDRQPAALETLEAADGATPFLLAVGRRLGDRDRDGHARWLGGLDCDDRDPEIHPGADEVPDNGVDEDCSGDDLRLAALRAAAGPAEDATRPPAIRSRPPLPAKVSLLLITIDTWRFDAAGFMGYPRNVTPHLDRLAAGATVYERMYGLGTYTPDVIVPLMTGKYVSELRRSTGYAIRFSGKETLAAEKICGPHVHCAGVMPHALFEERFGWVQGFQEIFVTRTDPPGPGHASEKYSSHHVADQALRWLENPANTAGCFWLWVHFLDPHREYLEHENFEKFGDGRRDRYDHEVLYTDYHVGRLLAYFRTLPAFERTVIIVTGDHGEGFGEHQLFHGKDLWEEIIRVPMFVAGPGIPARRIARRTSQIDLFPTLLDLFGVNPPAGIHGRSLLPDWVPGQLLPERPIFADQPAGERWPARRAFIKDGWKLHHLPAKRDYRLYELTGDWETGESLVDAEPEKFAELKAAYELFLATEIETVRPVEYPIGPVDRMPEPPRRRQRGSAPVR